MRALLTDIVHILLSLPLYLFLGLLLLAGASYRSAVGTWIHRWRHYFAVLGILVYVLSVPATAVLIESQLEGMYSIPATADLSRRNDNVIVVLTAGWLRSTHQGYEQKIGEAGWERTMVAVKLWRQIGGRLLFSGAPDPGGGSAADKMAQIARQLGVPEKALLVERASLNTHENLLFSRQLIGDHSKSIWLVTSALHMPRSVAVAQALGLVVIPYPCDFRADQRLQWQQFLPANAGPVALEAVLHELLGILQYRLRGWV